MVGEFARLSVPCPEPSTCGCSAFAEVQHLHRAVGPDLDVRRLEIAVNDTDLVGGFQSGGHLQGNAQRLLEIDTLDIRQRLAEFRRLVAFEEELPD